MGMTEQTVAAETHAAEPLAPESFAEWNEQMLQRYDPEAFSDHPKGVVRWVEKRRNGALLSLLSARPGEKILDVGCGSGYLLSRLPGTQRFGIDLSPTMVGKAQQRLGREAEIRQGDAEKLPFADGAFDAVIASSIFSHVLHPEQVAAEIRRVTKPGGRMVVSICNEDKVEKGIRWARRMLLEKMLTGGPGAQRAVYHVDYHLHRFSVERLREIMGAGVRELTVRKIPVLFPVHWVVLFHR